REDAVHDADALVIDAGDPLAPEVGQVTSDDHPGDHGNDDNQHRRTRDERQRLVERNRLPGELAEEAHLSPTGVTPGTPPRGPSPGGRRCITMSAKSPGRTDR